MDGPETKGVFFFTVNNFINYMYINASTIVNDTSIVTKTAMKIIKERLTQLDNEEFVHTGICGRTYRPVSMASGKDPSSFGIQLRNRVVTRQTDLGSCI
jgi:hypothetical protein